ncbi:cell division ATP-binding protein FtsE [Collinsella tanakaei]|uniref:cell division ATP-binding protein FtsE n=1 Tax=Collinsella tanakaei TaxID=626935 RepID=UPI0025A4C75D|nr:cell division ATP-binding protein FtsE [Collinsella tanakaei]MDM8301599.1 cell division ATP-binding protein FtsE [Collinsella tanakaei]
MGNHFRKPGDEQATPQATTGGQYVPGHVASTDGEDLFSQASAPTAQPVADPFAYNPAPEQMTASQTADPLAAPAPAPAPAGGIPLANIPSPDQPSAPVSTGVFMTQAGPAVASTDLSEQRQIADVDTALQSPDFTSVFAPVGESRKKMAREAGVEPVILMEHLTKIYAAQPNKPALDDVNIEIYPGEFVFLVGHSGSGKTTLLSTMVRDVKPTSGRVLVAGQDLMRIKNRKVPFLRRQIGTVFQDFKLLPNKTAYENVAFALECIGKPRAVIRSQVPEVLRLVGLADQMDSYPDQLSGGEQQRVAVARAMVNRPPLLICDEPTGNLDPAISLGIMKLLERINRTGTTVVVATHDREMVDSMHRRVIALEAGHVVRDQERGGYGSYGA